MLNKRLQFVIIKGGDCNTTICKGVEDGWLYIVDPSGRGIVDFGFNINLRWVRGFNN